MSRRWFQVDDPVSRWSIAAVAAVVFFCGLLWQQPILLGGGAVVLCLMLRRVGKLAEEQPTYSSHGRRPTRGAPTRSG